MKNDPNNNEKAQKILLLAEDIRSTKIKRKTLMRAYTEEIKRLEAEQESILTDSPSNEDLLQKDIHDLEAVK